VQCWLDLMNLKWSEMHELSGYLEIEEARREAEMIRAATFGQMPQEKREEIAGRINKTLQGLVSDLEQREREEQKAKAQRINIMILEKFW